jgi:hypothetical protein
MEEEYRAQKATQDTPAATPTTEQVPEQHADADTTVAESETSDSVDHGGETDMPPLPVSDDTADEEEEASRLDRKLSHLNISSHANASSQSIPTIKISTESDHEREQQAIESYLKEQEERNAVPDSGATNGHADSEEDIKSDVPVPIVQVEAPPLEKPAQAQASAAHARTESQALAAAATDPGAAGNAQAAADATTAEQANDGAAASNSFSFTNKRLCERWLDNLFMVLYEVSAPRVACFFAGSDVPLRTCACTPSGAPRWRTTAPSRCRTARRARSGRFSASWRCACTTRRRARTRSSAASTPSSRQRRCCACLRSTPSRRTWSARCGPACGSLPTTTGAPAGPRLCAHR